MIALEMFAVNITFLSKFGKTNNQTKTCWGFMAGGLLSADPRNNRGSLSQLPPDFGNI